LGRDEERDGVSWSAVVAALDANELFRSKVSVFLHPLAGRPVLWHVLRALCDVNPPPKRIRVLHHASWSAAIPDCNVPVDYQEVVVGDDSIALRAALSLPGMHVLVDGAAVLLDSTTIGRLLRAGEHGIAALPEDGEHAPRIALAGTGAALAAHDDPRRPAGVAQVSPTSPSELQRVVDRHTLSVAAVAVRDRLVRQHEEHGVTFMLPATSWVDVDVTIGADTLVYPGVVLEGSTHIGNECVVGPYSRIVESRIGRGVELKGWNYVVRTVVRNHVVLQPYERRGVD
jgi:bifunctional N-acetylglucosamine-1-phosphate-uridyltransferase/glucosamine-1-phosphate-acetyltransferase GlmU-like protein